MKSCSSPPSSRCGLLYRIPWRVTFKLGKVPESGRVDEIKARNFNKKSRTYGTSIYLSISCAKAHDRVRSQEGTPHVIVWMTSRMMGGLLLWGDRSPPESRLVLSQSTLSWDSDWLRQITWLWDKGNRGFALGRGPIPSQEWTGPLIYSLFWASDWLRQSKWGDRGLLSGGYQSPHGSRPLDWSPHLLCILSLWLAKTDHMGVHSDEGTSPLPQNFTGFVTFDSNSTSELCQMC